MDVANKIPTIARFRHLWMPGEHGKFVLLWGQISFWGFTVITNLLSSIPYLGTENVNGIQIYSCGWVFCFTFSRPIFFFFSIWYCVVLLPFNFNGRFCMGVETIWLNASIIALNGWQLCQKHYRIQYHRKCEKIKSRIVSVNRRKSVCGNFSALTFMLFGIGNLLCDQCQ